MLKRIFFASIGVFLLYNIYLWIFPLKPGNHQYASWVKENHAKAEMYLRADYTPSTVLCGSSLTSILNPWLADSIFEFSTTGGSWLTGFEIIRKTNKFPKRIGIELNFILRTEDTYITNQVLHKVWRPLHHYIPALRAYHQPLDLLSRPAHEKDIIQTVEQMTFDTVNPMSKTYALVLPEKAKEYQTPYDSLLLKEMTDYIIELKSEAQQHNCDLFLYLMPMDTVLLKSNRIQVLLNEIESLGLPVCLPGLNRKWQTSDSEHLRPLDANLFAKSLVQWLNQNPINHER